MAPDATTATVKKYGFRQRFVKHDYSLLGADVSDEEEEEENEAVTPAMTAAAAAGRAAGR